MNKLSEREIEILDLILNEFTSAEIAENLNLSIRTVDSHRRNIIAKTQAKSLIGLFKYALKNHLISFEFCKI